MRTLRSGRRRTRARRTPARRLGRGSRRPARGRPRRAGRRGRGRGAGSRGRRRLGGEAVAHAEVRVDVAPVRRRLLELLAQLAHEDVDRAVAAGHRVAPDALVDLLALEHAALGAGQQLDQLELAAGELDRAAVDERLELVGADLELAGRDRAARRRAPRRGGGGARRPRRARSAPRDGRAWSASRRRPGAARGRAGRRSTGRCRRRRRGRAARRAELLEVLPALRAEHREVDDERAEAHARRSRRPGRRRPATRCSQPRRSRRLVEDLQEAGVGVDDRDPQRGLAAGAIRRRAPASAQCRQIAGVTLGQDVHTARSHPVQGLHVKPEAPAIV